MQGPVAPIIVCILLVIANEFAVGAVELGSLEVVKLSRLKEGTELFLIERELGKKDTHRLEDFFWTGSGDGGPTEDDDHLWITETTTTVYETRTILSTVYVDNPASTSSNQTQIYHPSNGCSLNCHKPVTSDGEISPTPTFEQNGTGGEISNADRNFWLLTVLKSDGRDPIIADLQNSLEKLYKTAFERQQERHLGIQNRSKREAPEDQKPVHVYIHNVSANKGDDKVEVLYHVAVGGRPIPATTAAADMGLVSDEEVTNQLGYPFYIKAEPYLKMTEPLYLANGKNTWMFIGISIAIVLIVLLVIAMLTLSFSKRNRTGMGDFNRQQAMTRSVGVGKDSLVALATGQPKYQSGRRRPSPTYINFRTQPSNITLKSEIVPSTPGSTSSSSSYSATSLDISPLMAGKRVTPAKRTSTPRPKAALNKTLLLQGPKIKDGGFDSDSDQRDSPDTIVIGKHDPGIVSPKSYLSMPSVKSFPRCNVPEALNKVLEPVSILHLDGIDDNHVNNNPTALYGRPLSRHGSLSAFEDPGVIGPVVWNKHCEEKDRGVESDGGLDVQTIAKNVTRVRKRFHDLLDDTFSLFGSSRGSPEENMRPVLVETKSHSAINTRSSADGEATTSSSRPRPKTSDPHRVHPKPTSEPPRGAWHTNAPSPLVRPLSAGVLPPQVDVTRVLAAGTLPLNDPALPLIAAIKSELSKCSLPGSTTDLAD